MVDDLWWDAYGRLAYTVKTGKPAFEEVTGVLEFAYHDQHPEVNERFIRGMANFGNHENHTIVEAYDFSSFNSIVDVGGGRGDLIAEILRDNPVTRGVLYDRADVVSQMKCKDTEDIADRCHFVAGDFFTSVPAGADAYLLKRIIHDWDDNRSEIILRNCRKGMNSGGRILVIDAVLSPGNTWHPGKSTDLLMMTLLGGRERTAEEFASVFHKAGFNLKRVIATRSTLSIVEGVAN